MYPGVLYSDHVGSIQAYEGTLVANRAGDQAGHSCDEDPSLRSCEAVIGYHIHASDGDIGHVSGFLV